MTTALAIAYGPREQFVQDVVTAFERAGVEFVLLHGHDLEARDSDLDVAVTRRSLGAVDALVRAGTVGRMLQRLHYDVPWCFYYVLESEDPGRRYRQLDVACDPWGIGRYGPALPIALDFLERNPGARALDAATEAAYLAVKRSRKGIRYDSDRARLAQAAPDDLRAAAELLDSRLGPAAGRATSLLTSNVEGALASLAAEIGRYRRAPARLALRASFQAARVLHRVRRPTGLVVALVGPDGTGKSTLAQALSDDAGAFRRVDRRHLGPGLLPPAGRLLGRRPPDTAHPHMKVASGAMGTNARLAYLWADALLGWLPRMTFPRVRSSLVVLERGWFDLAVDPRRYRLSPRPRAVRLLGHLVPRPDLVLLLETGADLVQARKGELDAGEIERQLCEWRTLLPRAGRRVNPLDVTGSPDEVLDRAQEAINRELQNKHPNLRSAALPLRIAGRVARGGHPMALVEVDHRPRWLIPRRLGGRGPMRLGLYRPARRRQGPGAFALEAMASAGRLGTTLPIDLDQGLLPALRTVLGHPDLELGAIALSRDRQDRVLLTLFAHGRLVAFGKISAKADPLHHEGRVLEAIAQAQPDAFSVPRAVALLEWEGLTVLVLEPISFRARAFRPFGSCERAVLEELPELRDALAPVLGSEAGLVPVHGDFTPWNTAPTRAGGYVVWDWEDARLGLPLEDLFHWRTQGLVLFGAGSVKELVRGAQAPEPWLAELCTRLELDTDAPSRALRAYLERRSSDDTLHEQGHDIAVRALAHLDGDQA